MAIERQTRRVSLPRIGVVNVNTGAEQTWKTIARTAENIANDLAPFAQKRAEDAGENTAKAVARQNLIDFDNTGSPNPEDDNYNPNFGKPKAFAVPKEFGLVARSAYERVIERRFEESMQQELELKSIELSGKAKNSNEYNQLFTNYLSAMDKAADGRFGEYIANTGTAILQDTLLKLQIKEQEAAVKFAKKQAKENKYFALRKLSNSVGMVDDPESVNEVMTLARNASIRIEEEFALTKDKIQYQKDLDELSFAKAGALTNLLSTSTANLPESERLRIAGAFTNPALIKTIKSKVTRQAIRKIIETSNGMNLDKLSESFTKQVDAVDQIQKAEDTEYFSNNESLFNQIITRASFTDLVSSMTVQLDKAPEESKPEIEQLFANAIGNEFISELTGLSSIENLNPKELQIVQNQIRTITNMQKPSTDPAVQAALKEIKQTGVRDLVVELLKAPEMAQTDALDKLGTVIDPKAKADELIEEERKREEDEQNAIYTALATKTFDEFEALYKDAKDKENTEEMERLYLEMLNAKNEKNIPLTSYLGAEDLSAWTKITALNRSAQQKVKNTVYERKTTATEKENVNKLLEELRNAEGISQANNIKNRLKKTINSLGDNHTQDYIGSKLKETDTEYAKFVTEDQASQDLNLSNQVEDIKKSFQDLQETGETISEKELNKALQDVTDLLSKKSKGLDKASESDAHKQILNNYALSIIQPLMDTLEEKTEGNGVAPLLLSKAIAIANSKNLDRFSEFVKDLDKDSALYVMAEGLFEAAKFTTAKSEIRTQIGKLSDYNTKQFNEYTKEIEINNALDSVDRLGNQAFVEDLRTYEDREYTALAGLPEGSVIDYNDQKLFMKPDGKLTKLGQRIFDDLQKGTRVPNLVAALELGASAGLPDGSFLFSIFAQGLNQQPNGTNNNVWVQGGNIQLSPDSVAKYAAAELAYRAGLYSTPAEALREYIASDQQVGEGGIKKYLKDRLDMDLGKWIAENYSDADNQASKILEHASYALGRNIKDGSELKKILDGFIKATFGHDDKVLGDTVDTMSGYFETRNPFGSRSPLVTGARSKYIDKDSQDRMDVAASQLIFENISDLRRAERFTTDGPSLFTQMLPATPLGLAAEAAMPQFLFGDQFVGRVVDDTGQIFYHKINFKYRESTEQSGVYYILLPTQGGNMYEKLMTPEGVPVLIDAYEYQDRPTAHPNMLFYTRDFARALSLDPNGGKFIQFKGLEPIAGDEERILNEDLLNTAPEGSVPLLRAEQALMFMRFPEMLANPINRQIFRSLVEQKVIREQDVDFFLPFLEQYTE